MREADVIIIGAGPAGLAAAAALRERDVKYLLLERGDRWGQSWIETYDSLRLHTGKHLSHLPGLRFDRATPLFPRRADFLRYLDRYVEHHRLDVETGWEAARVLRAEPGWIVEAEGGIAARARVLVMATGIMANPWIPPLPERDAYAGSVLHSVEYRRPDGFAGQRVLVVGVGNSGGEIATELAHAGADVTVAVRSGANVVPMTLFGVPTQYLAVPVLHLPPRARNVVVRAIQAVSRVRHGPPVLPKPAHGPLDGVPLMGFQLAHAIRAGRIAMRAGIEHFTGDGVRFLDGAEEPFESVILATGFRPALQPVANLVATDELGFALRSDRVRSARYDDLFFIGHNYDSTGGLANIRRDALLLAEAIAPRRA